MCETAHVNALAGRVGNQNLQSFSQRSFDNTRQIPALPIARLAGYAERNRRL